MMVGLGNRGPKYEKNRHNAGFQVLDQFAARHGWTFSRRNKKAKLASGQLFGISVVLVKPWSYMNNSGGPVANLKKFYKLDWEDLLIIFDEIDLPLGTIRMRPEGGHNGQNGMRSVISQLGGNRTIPRMRIGVDRPKGRMEPAAYLLQDFGRSQLPIIEETYERAADAIETWLTDGMEQAMSRHNGPAPERQ
ncbi:MAG: aminoacyl-tRNA hydrolase [Chloroflexi bacterium]|nr:aminoacyl-tRNA hydrolase [Chloroflexota bacterium]